MISLTWIRIFIINLDHRIDHIAIYLDWVLDLGFDVKKMTHDGKSFASVPYYIKLKRSCEPTVCCVLTMTCFGQFSNSIDYITFLLLFLSKSSYF